MAVVVTAKPFDTAAAVVERLGSRVTRDFWLIDAVVATLLAGHLSRPRIEPEVAARRIEST